MSRDDKMFSQKAFSGIHIISPEIFSLIKMKGKFSMVDVYLELAETHTITAFDHSTSKFIDVGKPESIVKAEEIFNFDCKYQLFFLIKQLTLWNNLYKH